MKNAGTFEESGIQIIPRRPLSLRLCQECLVRCRNAQCKLSTLAFKFFTVLVNGGF